MVVRFVLPVTYHEKITSEDPDGPTMVSTDYLPQNTLPTEGETTVI